MFKYDMLKCVHIVLSPKCRGQQENTRLLYYEHRTFNHLHNNLHIYTLTPDRSYTYCKTIDTIEHFLVDCPNGQLFWETFTLWWKKLIWLQHQPHKPWCDI